MSVFFNGRLWISPATMTAIDDSALANKSLSVGNNLLLIGTSEGGAPGTVMAFGGPAEAASVLRAGPLRDAVIKSFDPSAQTGSPATVMAIRVNPATRSGLILPGANGQEAIRLESTDFGQYTAGIKVKVETGSVRGKKLTTQLGKAYFSDDNIARKALEVSYSGADSATISVNETAVTLRVAGVPDVVIALDEAPTIQELADRINSVSGFLAVVQDGNGDLASLQALDHLTDASLASPVLVTADLQACIDWFNGAAEGLITALRGPAGVAPDNLPFTFLAGGSNGATTIADWADAYTLAQSADVQFVVPLTANPAIHAMNDAHCAFMSNVARMERRGIVGGLTGISDDAALLAAKNLNSDRSSFVHLGYYDFDAAGKLRLFPAYMLAAVIAAAFAGSNPGTALTNKSLKVRGLERKLRNPTDTDKLILGGVLCVEDTPRGYRVVKSITTWQNNANFNRVEISVGVALDFTARSVRNTLDELRGAKGTPQVLGDAVSRVESTLRQLAQPEPVGPGVLVGDPENPAYKNIRASLEGDVMRVEFQCSPVIPVNYIPVAIYAVPYSGSASA